MVLLHRLTRFLILPSFLASFVLEGSYGIENINVDYSVPVFTIRELQQGSRRNELEEILASTGLLSVVGSEKDMLVFKTMRNDAFSGLCTCMKGENNPFAHVEGVDSSMLSDETTRITLATATMGNTPLPLNNEQLEAAGCEAQTVHAMDALRDYVAFTSHVFVTELDHLLEANHQNQEPILETARGSPFTSVTSIVRNSQNLEHFHVYEKSSDASDTYDLDFHSDAGLFLTFVPGMQCNTETNVENSDDFYIQVNDTVHRAIFAENSIGIMLGVGAEHWLRTNTKLHATRHAVGMRSGQNRAWYGMMHLVPPDAVVQDFPMRTFADMRKAMSGSEMKDRTFLYMGDDERDDISIGCGVSRSASSFWTTQGGATRINRRRLQMVDDASACNNATNFFCWMSCLEIPDVDMAAEKINDGYSLYCLDPAKLFDSGNNVSVAHAACIGSHNDGCMGSWQQTVPGVPSQDLHVDEESLNAAAAQFCYGGTSMYMDGFHWTDPTCIIYLFPNWVLSSSGRLVGASIGTLFFGVALEAVIWKRRSFVQSVPLGWKRLTASTLFYGLQLTMGYMIMLVVMTYSGPLFMCVIFGLMSGHAIFNAGSVLSSKSNTESRSLEQDPGTEEGPKGSGSFGSQTTIPEGITPCCQNTL